MTPRMATISGKAGSRLSVRLGELIERGYRLGKLGTSVRIGDGTPGVCLTHPVRAQQSCTGLECSQRTRANGGVAGDRDREASGAVGGIRCQGVAGPRAARNVIGWRISARLHMSMAKSSAARGLAAASE